MMLQLTSEDLDYIRFGLVIACLQLSVSEASSTAMELSDAAKAQHELRARLDGLAQQIANHSRSLVPNCGQCDGFGKCSHCKGTGGANLTDDCEYCNASGKCSECHGSGLNYNETQVFQSETLQAA